MKFYFRLFIVGFMLFAGWNLALVNGISVDEFNSIWSGTIKHAYYSGGIMECNPDNPVRGCVSGATYQQAGSFENVGDVQIRKLVWPTSTQGIFDVHMLVRGKKVVDTKNTCSVVLFDVSQSMRECSIPLSYNGTCMSGGEYQYIQGPEGLGEKWYSAVSGAILFSQEVIKNPNAKVGLVFFGKTAHQEKSLSNEELLSDDFANDPVKGDTNLHHGLIVASELLDSDPACEEKNIVIMSDGVPSAWWDGSGAVVSSSSATPKAKATGYAETLKDSGVVIYAIGYEVYPSGEAVLREVASSGNYYNASIDNIRDVFKLIGEFKDNAELLDLDDEVGISVTGIGGDFDVSGAAVTETGTVYSFQIKIEDPSLSGWQKSNNGLTLRYNDISGDTQTLLISPDMSAEIYWDIPTVTVTFNPNGGTPDPINPLPIESGSTIDPDDIPDVVKTGHHLTGWTIGCDTDNFFDFSSVVTGDITLCAKWEPDKYLITFKNWNGVVLRSGMLDYGTTPTEPSDPTRPGDSQHTYTFAGWTPEIHQVNGAQVYTATYTDATNKYTVTINVSPAGYGTVTSGSVKKDYGSTISINGNKVTIGGTEVTATPTGSDTQYTYTFSGWDNTCGNTLTSNCTITAQFKRTTNQYTATINVSPAGYGTVTSGSVKKDYGSAISINGNKVTIGGTEVTATPTGSDAQYTYTFSGWNNACGNTLTSNCTITAQFKRTTNQYLITFKNRNGTVLRTGMVAYGATPTAPADPTRPADAQYTYTFTGWTPEIHQVNGAQVYTATYTEAVNKYTVTWKNRDGTTLETDENVPYGTAPTYDGATPTKPTTTQYTYSFTGWTPVVSPVTGNIEYTAQFNETKRPGSSGGGGHVNYACENLPLNAEVNNTFKPSSKNVDYYFSTDVSQACTFQCKLGYVWNEKTKNCEVVPEEEIELEPTPTPDPVIPGKACSIEGSKHSAEVNEAYIWACQRGIIKSNTIQGAKLGEFLNRAEMAKITTVFEMLELKSKPNRNKDCSAFADSMSGYNQEMKNYMITSCQLERMGIHTADHTPIPDFMPRKFVSRAEFGTILSRILWEDKYEAETNTRYYYVDHLNKLKSAGILKDINPNLVERRSYAILMIYRAAKMMGMID